MQLVANLADTKWWENLKMTQKPEVSNEYQHDRV